MSQFSGLFFRFFIVALLCLSACSNSTNLGPTADSGIQDLVSREKATRLAQENLIVDGHVDLPYRLNKKWVDVSKSTAGGDFDYPRAKEGGLDAPFMSIYVPSTYQETGGSKLFADSLIDMVHSIVEKDPSQFGLAYSTDEMEKNFAEGLISLPMGMENGAPIENDIRNVEYFYERGIRYITLTHSTDNLIGDSSYDTTGTWGGLSEFGLEVVKEMNRVGIMVDISHVSDDTFFDVMKISEAPAIASHSSVRHFNPGWERNMSDEMIVKLAENDGVVMINFGSSFIRPDSRARSTLIRSLISQFRKARGLKVGSKEVVEYEKEVREKYPMLYADIKEVADHFDHIVKLVGVEHVGFGSDYDGVGDTLPIGLKDVSNYPDLIYELLKRGYSEEDIAKVCSGNLLRVWKAVENLAGSY